VDRIEMKLNELIKYIPNSIIAGDGDIEVLSANYDSRKIRKGDLFCAIKGEVVDGNDFIKKAVANGATAVLTSNTKIKIDVPSIIVEDDRAGMALAANILAGEPTKKLKLIGITGTNGKTTCAHILQSILNVALMRTGRIGTVGWEFEGFGEELARTTPEAPDLLNIFCDMLDRGADSAVMEVTSISVPMKRVEGLKWFGGIFTNLSQDHLDLHGSMEEYFLAKKAYFDVLEDSAFAVSNIDDEYGLRILENTKAKKISFSLIKDADVRGTILEESAKGLKLKIDSVYGDFEIDAPYVGRFNAENVLACIAGGLAAGAKIEDVIKGVKNAPQVRGRMERLVLEGGVVALVDYAHTPDALLRALKALKPMTEGRIHVVAGAGGDRDRTKRSQMGKIASENSDYCYITSDNPRTEKPELIVEEVMAGAVGSNAVSIVDRREAIKAALDNCKNGDVLIVAGKGHETYQEVDGVKHHFDDREEILKMRGEAKC